MRGKIIAHTECSPMMLRHRTRAQSARPCTRSAFAPEHSSVQRRLCECEFQGFACIVACCSQPRTAEQSVSRASHLPFTVTQSVDPNLGLRLHHAIAANQRQTTHFSLPCNGHRERSIRQIHETYTECALVHMHHIVGAHFVRIHRCTGPLYRALYPRLRTILSIVRWLINIYRQKPDKRKPLEPNRMMDGMCRLSEPCNATTRILAQRSDTCMGKGGYCCAVVLRPL